jgi:hypothetical protein
MAPIERVNPPINCAFFTPIVTFVRFIHERTCYINVLIGVLQSQCIHMPEAVASFYPVDLFLSFCSKSFNSLETETVAASVADPGGSGCF